MIREYAVVSGVLLQDVVDDVNKRIGEGWQPLGGICMTNGDRYGRYCQAIVFEAPVETVVNMQNNAELPLSGVLYGRTNAAGEGDVIVRDAGGA